jgi:hypothetical protein
MHAIYSLSSSSDAPAIPSPISGRLKGITFPPAAAAAENPRAKPAAQSGANGAAKPGTEDDHLRFPLPSPNPVAETETEEEVKVVEDEGKVVFVQATKQEAAARKAADWPAETIEDVVVTLPMR